MKRHNNEFKRPSYEIKGNNCQIKHNYEIIIMKYKYKQSFKKSCGTTFNFLSHNSDFPLESLFLLGFFFFNLLFNLSNWISMGPHHTGQQINNEPVVH